MAGKKPPTDMKYDIKKSSYYVWFLGAKESRGLRGEEYIGPVVKHLVNREKDQEPIKVTLQVSNKGLVVSYRGRGFPSAAQTSCLCRR